MQKLTDEQWNRYLEKYEGLMWTISRKISGDLMTAHIEDNFSELTIAAIDSINSFQKLTGKSFDEAMEDKQFDQYTKTVLWNRKAKLGVPLTKRMPFRNKHFGIDVSPEGEEFQRFDIVDNKHLVSDSYYRLFDMFSKSDDNVMTVIDAILDDPTVISNQGLAKRNTLTRKTGLTINYVNKALDAIKRTLGKEFRTTDE